MELLILNELFVFATYQYEIAHEYAAVREVMERFSFVLIVQFSIAKNRLLNEHRSAMIDEKLSIDSKIFASMTNSNCRDDFDRGHESDDESK